MRDLNIFLAFIPAVFHEKLHADFAAYLTALKQFDLPLLEDEKIFSSLLLAWSMSDFVSQTCIMYPDIVHELIESGDLLRNSPHEAYIDKIRNNTTQLDSTQTFDQILRRFRLREMLRITWRDLAGWADFFVTVANLSALAEACIKVSTECHYEKMAKEYGYPRNRDGVEQALLVVALGKLGGRELNLSSDIDLMFVYTEAGFSKGGLRSLPNDMFFIQLGQRIINSLSMVSKDGFVFRVDMRLRPYGSDGPLVISLNGLEDYYQDQGRDWERYAMVRARVVTGNPHQKAQLKQIIRRFVYRQYIDYSVIHALRNMKDLLRRESEAKGLESNLKRGPGGIREIEFTVQAMQLTRGGRDLSLQQQNLLAVLFSLEDKGYMPSKDIKELYNNYLFLRNTEHRLQAIADKQTQFLPKDTLSRCRIAYGMGFDDWDSFKAYIDQVRCRVEKHFYSLLEERDNISLLGKLAAQQAELQLVWLNTVGQVRAEQILSEAGFSNVKELIKLLHILRKSKPYQAVSRKYKRRIDILFPMVLSIVAQKPNSYDCLRRTLPILEATMKQLKFIDYLLEDVVAQKEIIDLCLASQWLSDEISRYPILLEDLANSRALYAPLDEAILAAELRQFLVGVPENDLEQQMNSLRRFKHTHVLRVAASDITAKLPLMKVSDHLTFTACVLLREAQTIAIANLIDQHGRPSDKQGKPAPVNLTIIAYGKLAGIELGYGSDLDLVFLHGVVHSGGMTCGDEPIPNNVFYTRLVQRIVQIISVQTSEGRLYEIDMRLRPSGNSGPLVHSLKRFGEYQRQEAWTWEHQALVRSHAVTGDEVLRHRFQRIRQEVLSVVRDPDALKADVRTMREKMRQSMVTKSSDRIDVKNCVGGITDIEFIVQYCVLQWAAECPGLLTYPDNIRIIEQCYEYEIFSLHDAQLLSDAYRAYRAVVHALDLQNESYFVPLASVKDYQQGVQSIWERLLTTPSS